jgi:hypothetical protein
MNPSIWIIAVLDVLAAASFVLAGIGMGTDPPVKRSAVHSLLGMGFALLVLGLVITVMDFTS